MSGPLPKAGDRLPNRPLGPFDAYSIRRYGVASGDDNPLHLDSALAAQAGFAAPPVHGMALMAAVEPALAAWRPDYRLTRLNGAFVEPLLANEIAQLSGRVAHVKTALTTDGRQETLEILLRVTIQGPRRGPCMLGEAVLVSTAPTSAEADA